MNDIKEHGKSRQNMRNQYCSIFSANLIMFSHGCALGWFAPSLALLISENSPLASGPLTLEQTSWAGSINSIGAAIGCVTFGYTTGLLGCKRSLTILLAFPALIFWLTIIFQTSVYEFLFARFLNGWMYTGIESNILLYVAEVADTKIRGQAGSITTLFRNFGILLAYIIGAYVEYSTIPYICICFPIVFFVSFNFLPNTPQYFIQLGKFEAAKKSLIFYQGLSKESANDLRAVEKELNTMKSSKIASDSTNAVCLKDFCKGTAFKGMVVGLVLTSLHQLSGCFTIISYAVTIFDRSGSHLDAYNSTILLAVCLIAGTFFTTLFADLIGRRILLIISLFGCSIGHTSMATYSYLAENEADVSMYQFVPLLSLSFVMFCASIGIIPLALLCIVEHLPSKVRTIGLAICIFNLNVLSFTITKYFPILVDLIDLCGSFAIFAIACTFGGLFVTFILKETKGKDLNTI